MQVHWFRRVTDRYLDVPLRWFDEHPAGELLAHADADAERSTMAMQPLPFSLGVIVIIIVAMGQLALVDPLLILVGLALFPKVRKSVVAEKSGPERGNLGGRHSVKK